MDSPMGALMAALLTMRDLPPAQREIWRGVFDHYIFRAERRHRRPHPAARTQRAGAAHRERRAPAAPGAGQPIHQTLRPPP